jgi:hypothetical protein
MSHHDYDQSQALSYLHGGDSVVQHHPDHDDDGKDIDDTIARKRVPWWVSGRSSVEKEGKMRERARDE